MLNHLLDRDLVGRYHHTYPHHPYHHHHHHPLRLADCADADYGGGGGCCCYAGDGGRCSPFDSEAHHLVPF